MRPWVPSIRPLVSQLPCNDVIKDLHGFRIRGPYKGTIGSALNLGTLSEEPFLFLVLKRD